MRKVMLRSLVGVAVLALVAAALGAQGAGTSGRDAPYEGDLTWWYWAESDAPGADNWAKAMIAKYERLHPKVHLKLVVQATDTLIGAFRTAAQTKSGPDIAMQWATLPTLTPAWIGAAVPIQDLVPKSELRNWIGTSENLSFGKVWAMPVYLLGVPFVWNKQLFKQAGLNPNAPPRTWSQLLSACAKLKSAGITPIGMGNKDGFTGAWFFSLVGKQNLNSIDELKLAMLGQEDFSKPKFSGFYTAFDDLVKRGCFNDDIASLDLNQGWQLFPQKKAAMAWTTDGNARQWAKTLGEDALGVTTTPVWGKGRLAHTYDTTQSISVFVTSWSKHQQAAATFLVWLHRPENLRAWYDATGVFPADKRFPSRLIKGKVAKALFKLDTTLPAVWPENFLPPQVDQQADLPAGQMITARSGTPKQAVDLWVRVIKQWRQQHPDELRNYEKWAKG